MNECADVLVVEGLSIGHRLGCQERLLLSSVSLRVGRGEIVGLVGESGSGKSLTGLAALGICPVSPGVLTGHVEIAGAPIWQPAEKAVEALRGPQGLSRRRGGMIATGAARSLRGRVASMVFQEPLNALDPLHTVDWHLDRALQIHRGITSKSTRRSAVLEWLRKVDLDGFDGIREAYPQELSGGMCQRVMIASILAAEPALVIADEATAALDAVTEFQVVSLLLEENRQRGVSLLVITHDLALALSCCCRIYQMSAGRIVDRMEPDPARPIREMLDEVEQNFRRRGDDRKEMLKSATLEASHGGGLAAGAHSDLMSGAGKW